MITATMGVLMNRKISGIVKTVASISLAGGVLAAAAGPALAAAPNEAYGVAATGLISISPVGMATSDGPSPVTVAHVNIAGLLSARIIHDKADATSASSTIADIRAILAPLVKLHVKIVTSSCMFDTNTDTVSGEASIIGGRIGTLLPINLLTHPAPNTTISVPGIATITLNRQVTAPDGTLTVDAIYVDLLSGTQTLTLGTSVCNDASLDPVSILPGIAMPIGLGTLGLLALGGVGYYFSRRRRVTVSAGIAG